MTDLDRLSVLSLVGAFACVGLRGTGPIYGVIRSPLDADGFFRIRPAGLSIDVRFNVKDVTSAYAAELTRDDYRVAAEKQRCTLGGHASDPALLRAGVLLDVVLRVADGAAERSETWRGTIARVLAHAIEFAPLGCGDQTIEFDRSQLVAWTRPDDDGRNDRARTKTNRERLALRSKP